MPIVGDEDGVLNNNSVGDVCGRIVKLRNLVDVTRVVTYLTVRRPSVAAELAESSAVAYDRYTDTIAG